VEGSKFVLSRHAAIPLKPFNRFALKNLSRAFALTPEIETSLRRIFPPDKITTVPLGVSVESVSGVDGALLRKEFREFHGIPENAFLVATIGELSERSRQKEFVLAAQLIFQKVPEARFVIIGSESSFGRGYRNELKRLASVMGLESSFLWLDHADDSLAILSAVDVLVQCGDGECSVELVEAMSLGKPVIFRSRGIVDEPSLTVIDQDPVALSNAILTVSLDGGSSERIGQLLKTTAEERFSVDALTARIEQLYSDLF
jgi:glycosyltransferase involved in cell wall biosynthesis